MDGVTIDSDVDILYSRKLSEEKASKSHCKTSVLWNALLSIVAVIVLLTLLLECKDYLKSILIWINNQDSNAVFILFVGLFTCVSFPFVWGYMLLTVACGYFFGVVHGFITVVFSANLGVAIAHITIRAVNMKFHIIKLVKYDTMHAILRVISGPQAFKVVALARVSPIPFGIQNTIFALSSISTGQYLLATVIGLLPAQMINLYLGSTLRSIGDVISDRASTPLTGYIMFCIQITVGVSLMAYVIHKARVELREALINQVPSSVVHCHSMKSSADFIV